MKQQKAIEKRELLLYHWVGIIQELYPGKRTGNPYIQEVERLSKQLSLTQYLLFTELVHCVTLINKDSRANEKGKLLSSKEDVINALQLLLPKEKQLTNTHLIALEKLRTELATKAFTYQKAGVILRNSRSSVKRLITVLHNYGLIEKTNQREGAKVLLKLTSERESIQTLAEEDPFTIAAEEWEDYTGYYDTQYRT